MAYRKYNPHRSADWNYGGAKWKLSRSKIDLFMECPRCFYLDNKLGTKRPPYPSFTLNIAVDELLKREFDAHRAEGSQHPLQETYGIDAIPFDHADMEQWRDNFTGIMHVHESTGLTVSGAVDDVWVNPAGELIVVDYKATSKSGTIEDLADSAWQEQYARQLGVYQWLLQQNGFSVSDTGYFVYANASTEETAFDGKLSFEVTLVPCTGTTDWMEETLDQIKACLESEELPPVGEGCEYCPYRQAAGEKLQRLHRKQQADESGTASLL